MELRTVIDGASVVSCLTVVTLESFRRSAVNTDTLAAVSRAGTTRCVAVTTICSLCCSAACCAESGEPASTASAEAEDNRQESRIQATVPPGCANFPSRNARTINRIIYQHGCAPHACCSMKIGATTCHCGRLSLWPGVIVAPSSGNARIDMRGLD